MNKRVRITTIVTLAALLLAAGVRPAPAASGLPGAQAQGAEWAAPGTAAVAQPLSPLAGKEPGAGYAVQPGTAAGGGYQLGGADWAVRGISSASLGTAGGGGFRLEAGSGVRGTGTPCCCSYLPCSLKGYR